MDSTHDVERMQRVSASKPCPICEKPDWCLRAEDGSAAICSRIESAKRCGEAGWLHVLREPSQRALANGTSFQPNWPKLAAQFAANLPSAPPLDLGLPDGALD